MIIAVLALLGLLLVFLEFFLPGAILAVLGGLLLLLSCGFFFFYYPPVWGFAFVPLLLLALFLTCKLALSQIRKARDKGDFYLAGDQEGFTASTFDQCLIGREGIVATELKPAGHILIEGERIQAMSESQFIPKNTPVTVISGRGAYLIVKERKLS